MSNINVICQTSNELKNKFLAWVYYSLTASFFPISTSFLDGDLSMVDANVKCQRLVSTLNVKCQRQSQMS